MGYTTYAPIWPAGMQSITATTAAAVGITMPSASAASASLPDPNYAIIYAESTSSRWRDDGTAPTAAVGMVLPPNQFFYYDGNLRALKFIGVAGNNTIIDISLYRAGP